MTRAGSGTARLEQAEARAVEDAKGVRRRISKDPSLPG